MRIGSRRLHTLDKRLFWAVGRAHLPGGEPVLPRLSRAADYSVLWAGAAAALAVAGRPRAAVGGMAAIGVASAVVNLASKRAFGRKRPSAGDLPMSRVLTMPASASFPSGHSASAAAFATAVAMEGPRRVAVPVGVLAAAVCFSRVYTGVHFPGDVLAGAAIGAGAALLVRRVLSVAVAAPDAGREAAVADGPGAGLFVPAPRRAPALESVGAEGFGRGGVVTRGSAAVPGATKAAVRRADGGHLPDLAGGGFRGSAGDLGGGVRPAAAAGAPQAGAEGGRKGASRWWWPAGRARREKAIAEPVCCCVM